MNELPTEFGTVIGWGKYFQGRIHYYCAVVAQGVENDEFLWWVAGEDYPRTPRELLKEFGSDFVVVGCIEIDAEALDLAMVLDRERNFD